MDYLDQQILMKLKENARQSASDISKEIYLSTALMEISLEHPRYNELFIENIKKNPNIISCYYLTGEFDYLLKIACQSSEHLEQIHHWIKDQGGVRQTRTHYVLRTEKNIYSPLPEAKE